jgi:hypothetical protein
MQVRHRLRNGGCIASFTGLLHGLSSLNNLAIVLTQGFGCRCSRRGLAGKRLIQGLTESIPEFLLVLSVQSNALGIGLPTLLKGFDRRHTQHRLSGQGFGLFDHGLASCQSLILRGLQGHMSLVHQRLPLRLNGRKGLLTHMTRIAPALGKGM